MSKNDVRIISVEAVGEMTDIGAAACKSLPPGSRYRYARPLRYTLKDGRLVDGQARAETKPKLSKRIEDTTRYARDGMLWACYGDNGEYWGTSMRCAIGVGTGGISALADPE